MLLAWPADAVRSARGVTIRPESLADRIQEWHYLARRLVFLGRLALVRVQYNQR